MCIKKDRKIEKLKIRKGINRWTRVAVFMILRPDPRFGIQRDPRGEPNSCALFIPSEGGREGGREWESESAFSNNGIPEC